MSFHNQKTTSGFVKLAIIYDGTHFIQVSCFGVEIAELEHVRPCTTVHITELIVTGIKEAKYNNGTAVSVLI